MIGRAHDRLLRDNDPGFNLVEANPGLSAGSKGCGWRLTRVQAVHKFAAMTTNTKHTAKTGKPSGASGGVRA